MGVLADPNSRLSARRFWIVVLAVVVVFAAVVIGIVVVAKVTGPSTCTGVAACRDHHVPGGVVVH